MTGVLGIHAHGATIRMHDTGGKVGRCLRRGIPYEQPLLERIYAERFTGLAVDAGANIGNHALWLALVCGLRVAAFEPLHHELLAEHVVMNDAAELVRVYPYALADYDGQAVHVGKGRLDPAGTAATIRGEPDVTSGRWTGSGSLVPTRTLDSFDLTGVALIKVDVEGMEPHVLRGGEQIIRRDRPVIYAETWTDAEHDAIAAVLEPWGYEATDEFSSPESTTPVVRWQPA